MELDFVILGGVPQDAAQIGHGPRSLSAESMTLADIQRPLDFALKYGIMDKGFDVNGILAPSIKLSRK